MSPRPADADIRAELHRILSSPIFATQESLQNFLRFVVEQTLDGQAGGLKERTIGVEALGRRLDYDPKVDPIVRVQARRLREKLAEYYQSQTSGTELQIALPKGSYVPEFLRIAPPESEVVAAPEPVIAPRSERRLAYFLLGSVALIVIAGLVAYLAWR
jgi:hypothetical protein